MPNYAEIKENVLGNLKHLRTENDMSQTDFGNIVEVTKQAYQKIEKGTTEISLIHLCKFAEHFNMPIETLMFTDLQNEDV